jgi:hypothetical protein
VNSELEVSKQYGEICVAQKNFNFAGVRVRWRLPLKQSGSCNFNFPTQRNNPTYFHRM